MTYTLPEGYELTEELKSRIDELAQKNNLSNEAMQELIDLHVELTEDFTKELVKYLKKKAIFWGLIVIAVITLIHIIF